MRVLFSGLCLRCAQQGYGFTHHWKLDPGAAPAQGMCRMWGRNSGREWVAHEGHVLLPQGKVFPKLRKRSPQGSSESASDKEDDEATDYVFRIIYPGTQAEFGECRAGFGGL